MADQKKIKIWIKLEDHFIDQENIRSVVRYGNQTKIERVLGSPIIVDIDYDKVKAILPNE